MKKKKIVKNIKHEFRKLNIYIILEILKYFKLHIYINNDRGDQTNKGIKIYIHYFEKKIGKGWYNNFIKVKNNTYWFSTYEANVLDLYGRWGNTSKIFFLFKNIQLDIKRNKVSSKICEIDLKTLKYFKHISWSLDLTIIYYDSINLIKKSIFFFDRYKILPKTEISYFNETLIIKNKK